MSVFVRRARRAWWRRAAAGVVALAAVDAQAPAPSCRTYSAQEVRTLSGAGTGTIEQSCRFDTIRFESASVKIKLGCAPSRRILGG